MVRYKATAGCSFTERDVGNFFYIYNVDVSVTLVFIMFSENLPLTFAKKTCRQGDLRKCTQACREFNVFHFIY